MGVLSSTILMFLKGVTQALNCDLSLNHFAVSPSRPGVPLQIFPQPDTGTLIVRHAACIWYAEFDRFERWALWNVEHYSIFIGSSSFMKLYVNGI